MSFKYPFLYTKNSFGVAIMLFVLFAVMIMVSIVWSTPGTGGLIIPPILFMIIAGSITGSYFAFKSFKEKTDYRKIIGIVVNFAILILIVVLVITNMMDINRVFSK